MMHQDQLENQRNNPYESDHQVYPVTPTVQPDKENCLSYQQVNRS